MARRTLGHFRPIVFPKEDRSPDKGEHGGEDDVVIGAAGEGFQGVGQV